MHRLASVGRTGRWLVHGLASELTSNLLPGRAAPPPLSPSQGGLAVVTGATGGIGEEVCRGLAERGFEVCCAARDRRRGEALAASIREGGGCAFYVDLDLEERRPAERLARVLRGRRVRLLVNNAGSMGGSVGATLRVNLCAPASLAVALWPRLGAEGRVVNVGSSSHLRAAGVSLSATDAAIDRGLRAYAQSKLGLMHVSLLLRAASAASGGPAVRDCHPGVVWTPMLRRQLGAPLCRLLEASGASRRLFRTPQQGAATVLWAALSDEGHGGGGGVRAWRSEYFVDCRRDDAAASPESRDLAAARQSWRWLVEAEPELARRAAAERGLARAIAEAEANSRQTG